MEWPRLVNEHWDPLKLRFEDQVEGRAASSIVHEFWTIVYDCDPNSTLHGPDHEVLVEFKQGLEH
jgi:hypothetical protein